MIYRDKDLKVIIKKGKKILDLVGVRYIGDYPGKSDRPKIEVFRSASPKSSKNGIPLANEMGNSLVHYLDIEASDERRGYMEYYLVKEVKR